MMTGWRIPFRFRPAAPPEAAARVTLSNHARRSQRGGASLPAIAVTLAVAGTILLLTQGGNTRFDRASQTETMTSLDHIAEALVAYAAVAGHLPCPDTDMDGLNNASGSDCDDNQEEGTVPYRDIGLELNDVIDRWGRMVSYRVDTALVTPDDPNTATDESSLAQAAKSDNKLTICEADENTCADQNKRLGKTGEEAAFVLISHGPTGHGGIVPTGDIPDGTNRGNREADSTEGISGVDNVFYALPFKTLDDDGKELVDENGKVKSDYFDDIVTGLSIPDLYKRTGRDPGGIGADGYDLDLNNDDHLAKFVTTPDSKDGQGGEGGFIAGKRPGDDRNWLGVGKETGNKVNQLRNAAVVCSWYNQPLAWGRKETFRASLTFQFAPGENKANTHQGDGGGFALAFVPGVRKVTLADDTSAICGEDNTDQSMGLGYKGGTLSIRDALYDPAFPWTDDDYYGLEDGTQPTGTRDMAKMGLEFDVYNNEYGDEDTLEKNHVAILSQWLPNRDWIGNGSGNNPSCPPSPPASALYIDAGTDDPEPGPAVSRACTYGDDAAWLEIPWKSASAPWFVNGQGAPEHVARVEIERYCNNSCSSCGNEGIYTKMRFRAWVVEKSAMPVPEFATNLSKDLAEFVDYENGTMPGNFINYCGADPSVQQPNAAANFVTFDTIKLGVTAAARASGGGSGNGTAISITDLRAKIAE